jgi:hypothetical protein
MRILIVLLFTCLSVPGNAWDHHSEEFYWHAGHALAFGADMATTRYVLGSCQRTCSEMDPIYGKHPSTAKQLAIGIPISAAAGYGVHRLFQRKHVWLARTASAGLIANHAVLAAHNMTIPY